MEVLCNNLPKRELAALQLERQGSQWNIRQDLEDAVICYLKHLISLLDLSEDIHKPKEIIAAFGSLKGQLGNHWRALTAAFLLSFPSRLVWNRCPISNDIVTVLNDISSRFFPPHVISSIEDAALLFDFPYPKSKRDMLNSFTPACGLPLWLKSPWENLDFFISVGDIRHDLCYLHDYKRLYDICAHGGGGMDVNDSNMTSMESDSDDDDAPMMSINAIEPLRG
ncbi:hypothetical protein BJ165DRAFT_234254 [Panaeolus papilionaceus]|nr:hypothetical protein BJ165DRAFT_234254 [Panaeolus papilionaceus]